MATASRSYAYNYLIKLYMYVCAHFLDILSLKTLLNKQNVAIFVMPLSPLLLSKFCARSRHFSDYNLLQTAMYMLLVTTKIVHYTTSEFHKYNFPGCTRLPIQIELIYVVCSCEFFAWLFHGCFRWLTVFICSIPRLYMIELLPKNIQFAMTVLLEYLNFYANMNELPLNKANPTLEYRYQIEGILDCQEWTRLRTSLTIIITYNHSSYNWTANNHTIE